MDSKSAFNQVINLIEKSKNILILPSSPPDGDSLGSTVALYLVLTKLGKEVTAVCADPVPEAYQFLPKEEVIQNEIDISRDFIITVDCTGTDVSNVKHNVENGKVNIVLTPKKGNLAEKNVTFNHGEAKYDLIIVVDTGDYEQLGKLYEDHTEFFFRVPVINIDHHASNNEFGKVNLVDVTASSTTEILFELFQAMRKTENLIDPDTATALLAGIITDTGSFQNSNTTPKALSIAADLVDLGAKQQEIIKHIYKTKKLSTLRLWGRILENIKTDYKHRILWSTISLQDFKDTESLSDETGGIIDELMSNAPDMEVIILLKEREPKFVSGSVRTTRDAVDANKIASFFGGGGHLRAAGFRIHGKNLDTVEREIIEKVRLFQRERLPQEELEEPLEEQPSVQEQRRVQEQVPLEEKAPPQEVLPPQQSLKEEIQETPSVSEILSESSVPELPPRSPQESEKEEPQEISRKQPDLEEKEPDQESPKEQKIYHIDLSKSIFGTDPQKIKQNFANKLPKNPTLEISKRKKEKETDIEDLIGS